MMKLHTARLLLEPLRAEDLSPLHAHWTEPEVRRYLWDGRVVLRPQVRDVIDQSHWLFDEHGVGLWAARLRDLPMFIGCGGFWFFHEPPELELLVSLSSLYWRRGLAQEIAGVLFAHVFGELQWTFVQASADIANTASIKLLHRLGMRLHGKRPGEFGTMALYRLTSTEWRQRHEGLPPTQV